MRLLQDLEWHSGQLQWNIEAFELEILIWIYVLFVLCGKKLLSKGLQRGEAYGGNPEGDDILAFRGSSFIIVWK